MTKSNASGQLARSIAAARQRFDELCDPVRPELHRFCTRMTGSPCDGEDVLQEALECAFYRLAELRDSAAFRAWVFRIAHNKCIDLLRARQREPRRQGDPDSVPSEERSVDEAEADKQRARRVLSHIVTELPPRERACVVLKDVLDCSLEETADITGSSLGSVKAALHRGRSKLASAESAELRAPQKLDPARRAVVEAYLSAFNRRDWDAVQALVSDDARLEVVHRTHGPLRGAPYFANYADLPVTWKLELAEVDGVERVVHFRRVDGAWHPHSLVELVVDGDRVSSVRDYVHVDYLLHDCEVR